MSSPTNPGNANPGASDPGHVDTSDADAGAPTPAARKIAPIPDKARDEGGRFAKSGHSETGDREPGGLPDILTDTSADGIDDYDRAKSSLDGGLPESAVIIKPTKKTRAKDILVAPRPASEDGAPAEIAGDADPNGDAVALGPDGQPAVPAVEPGADEPIVVAGVTFRNKAHLEQNFSSLRGMYNTEVKRATQLKHTAASNYEAAMAWRAKAVAADPSLSGQGTSAPGAPTASGESGAISAMATKVAGATGATEESILKSINWDNYKKIRETHDAETALLWANEQMLNHIVRRFDSRLDEMTRPAKETQVLVEKGERIGQTMLDMAGWTFENTTDPVFPELSDSEAIEEIGQVVVAMSKKGLPLEFFHTPEGINQAVLTWRDWRSRNKRPWSAAGGSSSPAPVVADPHAAAVASVRAANAPGALVGRSAPVRPANGAAGRGAEIVRAITESSKPTDFGWAR